MPQEITNLPNAGRTFKGLADIGYTFESSVADLLDNSITQGEASNIHVLYDRSVNGFFLRIIDDGKGMSDKKLYEAMTIGSSADNYKKGDLSKYGFGMKTASMSNCNILTVISKETKKDIAAYSWDMEILKEKGWKVLKYSTNEIKARLKLEKELLGDIIGSITLFESNSWTMVCWDNLETQETEYLSKRTEQARDRFAAKNIDTLTIFLRTVFHRFLSGENHARRINIYINGKKLKPFDPFCRNESNTTVDVFYNNEGVFEFDSNKKDKVIITRYILPTKEGELGFSNLNSWKEAAGYLNWNDAQGYYVYRNNRLIDFGGWFGTKGKDEHDKLARVSIDLTDEHDKYFTLDVKKTSVQFQDQFRHYLQETVNKSYIKRAKERYKKAEKKNPPVKNKIRDHKSKVKDLSTQLVKSNEITVTEKINKEGTILKVNNPSGEYSEKDLLYRELDPTNTIITTDFGNEENFWKMVPGPGNYFQILINESHPFYEKIYLKAAENKVATSSVDTLLYTLAFIELRFKTNENRALFLEINEVASDILKRVIDKNLL